MAMLNPASPPSRWRVFVRDALVVGLLNACVALVLSMFSPLGLTEPVGERHMWVLSTNMVYAQSIGMAIFGLIESQRLTRWWQRKPGLAGLSLWVAAAIPAGFVLGSTLASLTLTGELHMQHLFTATPFMAGVYLVTVACSLFTVYFLTQRERLAEERLRAETAELRARAAQLQLLQAQIEPHMLFNTLANVHALVEVDGTRAQRMLECLSELLRASMQMNALAEVALRQEFTLLQHYLQLMAMRMGERLSYRLSLPETLAGVRVPPLLVQPLVENAVKHGVEPSPRGGTIEIVARCVDGQLVIEVSDDGLGLSSDAPDPQRIGLANVRQRLLGAFGASSRLEVHAREPRGTVSRLTLPLPPGLAP